MNQKCLNIGIVGCGEIAINRHIPAWSQNKKVKLMGICDIDINKAKKIAKMFNIPYCYDRYSDLLNNDDINIIDIVTPIKLHGEQAIAAIKKHKHVIVEKPMAGTVEECEKMLSNAKTEGVKLSIFHTMKAYPIIKKIKGMIDANDMEIQYFLNIITQYEKLKPWVFQQGGPLWEIGIHRIYLAQYLLGDINKIDVNNYRSLEDIDITLYQERGISRICLLYSDFTIAREIISIHRKKDRIIIPFLASNSFVREECKQENWKNVFMDQISDNYKIATGVFRRGIEYIFNKNKILPHYIVIDNFINSIISGDELLNTPEEGIKTIKILTEIDNRLGHREI